MVKRPFVQSITDTSRIPLNIILNGELMIFKHEIAMNLATEGFRVVSLESQQSANNSQGDTSDGDIKNSAKNDANTIAKTTGSIYNSLGNLEQYLTDADCKEFMDGLENTIHDGELLYEHVTDFTTRILRKWGVET
jgi:hypothetical protein